MPVDFEQIGLELQNQFLDYVGSIVVGLKKEKSGDPAFVVMYSEKTSPNRHPRTWYNIRVSYHQMDKECSFIGDKSLRII